MVHADSPGIHGPPANRMNTLATSFRDLHNRAPRKARVRVAGIDECGDSPTDLNDALARMNLLAPGDSARFTRLGGKRSDIFRVDLGRGAICLKRPRHDPSDEADTSAARARAETAWLKLAHAVADEAIPEIQGELPGVFCTEYLAPESHPGWLSRLLDGDISPTSAGEVGRLLGRLHAATANNIAVSQRFDARKAFLAHRIEPLFIVTAERQPGVGSQLRQLALSLGGMRVALIHGDPAPDNILIGPKGPVLIDAEFATYGDPAFDLALVLSHLLALAADRPQWRDRALTAFDNLCAAYAQRVSWEVPEHTNERAALLLPALLLAGVHGDSPFRWLHNPRSSETIAGIARRLLVLPMVRLAAVREAWRRSLPL